LRIVALRVALLLLSRRRTNATHGGRGALPRAGAIRQTDGIVAPRRRSDIGKQQ
jgi:hypothetical protein